MSTDVDALRAPATEKVPSFEQFFEHEHVLAIRILACATRIVEELRGIPDGEPIPGNVYSAMAMLVYLFDNLADQTHLKAEEAAIPIAIARGMLSSDAEWVFTDHDQARAYVKAMDVAWRRINAGDETDLPHAIDDFARCAEGLVALVAYHAEREDHHFFPEMARYLSEADDDLIMHVITQIGAHDVTPYVAMVADMEAQLGIQAPGGAPNSQD